MMTDVAKLFSERAAHFTALGFAGRQLFDRLAEDPELPFSFTAKDQAAIERVQLDTIRQRRKRGKGPEGNIIRSLRPVYCHWLRDRFTTPHERK